MIIYKNNCSLQKLKDIILRSKTRYVNVVVVDWAGGAEVTFYSQAASTARVVGKMIAIFISLFAKYYNYKPNRFHLIGHSLGCQVASFTGKYFNTTPCINRITAMDPAGPDFYHNPPAQRLDPSDATYVDVLHTNGAWSALIGSTKFLSRIKQLFKHFKFDKILTEYLFQLKKRLWCRKGLWK